MHTVLVIDPEPGATLVAERALQEDGHAVITAGAGEALETIALEEPDVVVLELGPPCGAGLELVEEILGAHPRLPIVLNTGYASYKDDFRSWAVDEYVLKSSGARELRRAVRRVMEKRTHRMQGSLTAKPAA